MKYFLMCEGRNEEVILNLLLDSSTLRIKRDDLIGRKVYPVRQLTHPAIISELKIYGGEVIVLRVGDKQTDELVIPNELKHIVIKSNIYKYCTKPELEILLIIAEDKIREYNKLSSVMSPKTFCKKYIKYNNRYYDQSSLFLSEYFGDINKLINALRKYKRLKKHNKDELYLIDLLK